VGLSDYVRLGWFSQQVQFWSCNQCRAVVTDRELHDKWHEGFQWD
jgi:hypothetical protein